MGIFAGEALSRADVAWLHAEGPTNHFVVTSLAILDAPLDVERLKSVLERRIGLHPHLTQVVADPIVALAPARWVRASGFDLDAHVHRVALPGRSGKAELAELVGDLAGQPLDFGRPLWQLYAVEGPGDGGALVSRFHHSLGDGHAMVRMLLTLTDQSAGGWRRRPSRGRPPAHRPNGGWPGSVIRAAGLLPRAPHLAGVALRGAGTLARDTLLPPDRPTGLRGRLGVLKAVSWSAPIPLADVKRIAKTSGTTVNDVVVSAIAGGLGAYLRRQGADVRGLRIRAMVPVNLRPADDLSMEGNRFSLVFLELPVGVASARERLDRVKHEMDRIKGSLEPGVDWLLVQALGFLPPALEHFASGFYAAKASLVLTNVIGPPKPVYVAGRRIRQMTFWEPESGGLGVGVSIYSYAGQVTVGVVSDRNLVRRPEQVTDEVTRAFGELARL